MVETGTVAARCERHEFYIRHVLESDERIVDSSEEQSRTMLGRGGPRGAYRLNQLHAKSLTV